MPEAIKIKREGLRTWTEGLNDRGVHDLAVEPADASLLPEAEALLRSLGAYMTSHGAQVEAEETLAYGYWAVKVRQGQRGRFELWEYKADVTGFVPGASFTLKCWRDQHEVCERYEAEFWPPQPDQLVVISDGVRLYHLTAARPDLARYLALPFGFRFDQASGEDVWFDEQVARE
jgi:hypothetical protein